jgi:hypothetical protein
MFRSDAKPIGSKLMDSGTGPCGMRENDAVTNIRVLLPPIPNCLPQRLDGLIAVHFRAVMQGLPDFLPAGICSFAGVSLWPPSVLRLSRGSSRAGEPQKLCFPWSYRATCHAYLEPAPCSQSKRIAQLRFQRKFDSGTHARTYAVVSPKRGQAYR